MGITLQPGALSTYDFGPGSTGLVGTGTTFAGTNASGTMNLGSAGLGLSIAAATAAAVPVGISAGTTSSNLQLLAFGDSNGLNWGLNGSTVTASYTVPSVPPQTSLSFSNANNVTFGIAGSTLTASASQSVQPQSSLSFSNLNGVTFGTAGSTLTASVAAQSVQTQASGAIAGTGVTTAAVNVSVSATLNTAGLSLSLSGPSVGGAQTGISGIIVSNTTYTSGTVSFSNANGISFGSSAGQAITASYTVPNVPAQTNQTLSAVVSSNTTGNTSGMTFDARSLSLQAFGAASIGLSTTNTGSSILFSVPVQSVQTQASGAIAGTGVTTAGANVSISGTLNTAGLSISISGPTESGVGLQVSNTTYTSGTITLQNANGISFGSSGAGGISASYTVPTVPALSAGVSTGGNTVGNTGTYSGQVVFAGGNNITLSVSSAAGGAQTITISGANAGGAQTGISGIIVSNTTYTSGTVSFSNANGISFGSSAGQAITASYTVPTQSNQTDGIYASSQTFGQSSSSTHDARSLSIVGSGAISVGWSNSSFLISAPTQSVQTQASGAIAGTGFTSAGANVSLSGTLNTAGLSLSASVAASTPLLSAGVSTGGNTAGNTGTYSGQVVFAGGNNITLSVSSAAGGAQTITISGPNAGGAQTGISGVQVSNTTYTSGTITFQNANGISFGSSGANGISASYTVPTQTNQTLSAVVSSNTVGNTSGMTFDARSVSFQAYGAMSVGLSTTNTGSSILLSAPVQTVQTQASGAIAGTGVTTAGANVSISGTLNTAGLSISISGNAAQTNQTLSAVVSSNTVGNTSGMTFDARSVSFQAFGAASIGLSTTNTGSSILFSAPVQTNQSAIRGLGVSNTGNTAGNTGISTGIDWAIAASNNITASESTAGGGPNTIWLSGPTLTQYFSNTGTTFNGVNVSGSMTLNTAGLQLSLSGGAGGGGGGFTGGVSTGGNTLGNTGTQTGQFVLAGGNNVTLSVGTAAGGAQTVTISAGAGTLSLYATGNTTNNSSSSFNETSVLFNAQGAQTIGFSNGSFQFSVPATSSLVGVNGISISTNGSTISVSNLQFTGSFYEPEVFGGTTTATNANGTVYFRPFTCNECFTVARANILQQVTTQPTTTMSLSASVSAGNASSGTGSWGQSGTLGFYSRVSTGTNANSSNIISFASASYSNAVAYSASVSWSTNASSATASWTTSAAVSFASQINMTGGLTTGSFGTSGSSTFSSTSTNANSFSSSYAMSFASQVYSQVRPLQIPVGTLLTQGEYWLGHIQSTNTGSTNMSFQRVAQLGPGVVYYTTNTSGYAEIGNTASNASSNLFWGIGSYSSSGQTTTTLPISQISAMSNYSMYFLLIGQTK